MNMWQIGTAALLVGLVPCGIACLRGSLGARLVSLELAGLVAVLTALLISADSSVSSVLDVAILLAFVGFVGGLVFTRFLGRWL